MNLEPSKADRLRHEVAALFSEVLQVSLLPYPLDLEVDTFTFYKYYPNKMRFMLIHDGKAFRLNDVVSINQTIEDLIWTIRATLPSMKLNVELIKERGLN